MREIYFLSLDLALSDIGAAIVDLPYDIQQWEDYVLTWRFSQAAANLHQIFHNVPEGRPKWLMPHPVTRRPIATEAAAAEGMALLVELSGWYGRQYDGLRAFPHARREPMPTTKELRISAYHNKYSMRRNVYDSQVGFDRTELILYLDSPRVDIPHRISADQTIEYIEMLAARRRARPSAFTVPRDQKPSPPTPQAPRNEKRTVPQLTLPAKSDAWAKAIEATYDAIAREVGNTPKSHEVWVRMHHKPPDNYPVTITKDRGLPAIALPGERPLTRDGFNKRWRRYTSAINPQARTTSDKSG